MWDGKESARKFSRSSSWLEHQESALALINPLQFPQLLLGERFARTKKEQTLFIQEYGIRDSIKRDRRWERLKKHKESNVKQREAFWLPLRQVAPFITVI